LATPGEAKAAESLEDAIERATSRTAFLRPDALEAAIGRPCPYCGYVMDKRNPWRMPTRDHVHPRSRGGRFDPANRLVVCRRCNGDKADMTLALFAAWLLARRDARYERVVALLRLQEGQTRTLGTRDQEATTTGSASG
jgi:5-methylcytosine-specific restriction endonuclease McrA